ncbi:hypothetical protein CDEST_12750 [Colletotrichum destructivum]|uniref:Uncharacterized protein n=1 Tax=Colletotrichum destructivum TaxID=34406 RepID=A0AAX4IX22_9PEZI|nr:hypothetical protein CDEST_12750 [Colletotrichum destructivum]
MALLRTCPRGIRVDDGNTAAKTQSPTRQSCPCSSDLSLSACHPAVPPLRHGDTHRAAGIYVQSTDTRLRICARVPCLSALCIDMIHDRLILALYGYKQTGRALSLLPFRTLKAVSQSTEWCRRQLRPFTRPPVNGWI